MKSLNWEIMKWKFLSLTFAIPVLVFYTMSLFPYLPKLLLYRGLLALLFLVPIALIIDNVCIRRLLVPIEKFRRKGEKCSRDDTLAALRAALQIPLTLAVILLVLWFAVIVCMLGVVILSAYPVLPSDALRLLLANMSAAAIVTIFQFFQYKKLFRAEAEEILRVSPVDLGEIQHAGLRVSISTVLLVCFLSLMSLSFTILALATRSLSEDAMQGLLRETEKTELAELEAEAFAKGVRDGDWEGAAQALSKPPEALGSFLLDPEGKPHGRPDFDRFEPAILRELALDHRRGYLHDPYKGYVLIYEQIGETGGRVVAFYDWSKYNASLGGISRTSLIMLLVTVAVVLLISLLISRHLKRSLDPMVQTTIRMAGADLRPYGQIAPENEIGDVAIALDKMRSDLSEMIGRITESTWSFFDLTQRLKRSSQRVSQSSESEATSTQETSAAMGSIAENVSTIVRNVDDLQNASKRSASAVEQMSQTVDWIAQAMDALGGSVDDSSSSTIEIIHAIRQIDENLRALSMNSEETSQSVSDMASSTHRIEKSASETTELSQRVRQSAGRGSESVSQTAQGITRIENASTTLQTALTKLAERIGEVDDIVEVITNVTDKTNLLALNASIIAAHAGEHGAGFAVVANEIKELADQTRTSTKQISEQILSIQTESGEALSALKDMSETVKSGKSLSVQSEVALGEIVEAALASSEHSKEIRSAIVQQAVQGEKVMLAVGAISEGLKQISTATAEQSAGGETIIRLSENMKETVDRVRGMVHQHAESARLTRSELDQTLSMTESIHSSTRAHSQSSKEIVRAMESIREVAEVNLHQAGDVAEAVEELSTQATQLAEEMKRFRL